MGGARGGLVALLPRSTQVCLKLAISVSQASHNRAGLGPTEPCTGCNRFLLTAGREWGENYRVARCLGLVPNKNPDSLPDACGMSGVHRSPWSWQMWGSKSVRPSRNCTFSGNFGATYVPLQVKDCWHHHYISDPTAFSHLLSVCTDPEAVLNALSPKNLCLLINASDLVLSQIVLQHYTPSELASDTEESPYFAAAWFALRNTERCAGRA